MHPLSLRLKGYRSYREEAVFRFGTGVTMVLGEIVDQPKAASNGAGKSTVLYAIVQALYGSEPHGGQKNDLINHQSDGYENELVLGDDHLPMPGDRLVIRRTKMRKGSEKLEWWHKGQHYQGNPDVVQAALLKFIGIPKELFCNTIFLSRTMPGAQFLKAGPPKRAELLEELVSDTRLAMGEGRAKAALKVLEEEMREAAYQRQALDREDINIKADLVRLQEQIAAGTEQAMVYAERRRNRIDHLTREVQALYQHLTDKVDLLPMQERLQKAQTDVLVLQQTIAGREALVGGGGSLDGRETCPTCLRPVNDNVRADRALALQAVKYELKAMRDKYAQILVEQSSAQKALTDGQANALHYNSLHDSMVAKTHELTAVQQESVPDFVGGFQAMQQQKHHRLQEIAQERSVYDNRILQGGVRKTRLEFWSEGYGRTGLKNLMLDEVRNMLAFYSHQHLFQLAGDTIKMTFPQVSATKVGAIREKFEITLSLNDTVQDICMYSDGQVWRGSFACMLGLGDALMHGTNTPLKFRLLDDPSGELDPVGLREFLLACEQLSRTSPIILTLPKEPDADVRATKINVVMRGFATELVKA